MNILEFTVIAAMCAPNVDITTLSALITQESQGNIYAIRINKKDQLTRQPKSYSEAVQTAQSLFNKGYNFDAGLGQINSANYHWLGLKIPDLFLPCKNLNATQTILTHCYKRATHRYGEGQKALRSALSCYNTGDLSKGFKNGYVQKIEATVGDILPGLHPPAKLQPNQKNKQPAPNSAKTPDAPEEIPDAFNTGMEDIFDSFQRFTINSS